MEVDIQVEQTPNPNALKFVLNQPVKTTGRVTYKTPIECAGVPLAVALFNIPHVNLVHLFGNVITVAQEPDGDLAAMEEQVRQVIIQEFPQHNPDFKIEMAANPLNVAFSKDIEEIEAILEETIRPGLRADGGDLEVVSYDNNVLTVYYQGACGSCPSARMGTLNAIQNILRNEYNPTIEVVTRD